MAWQFLNAFKTILKKFFDFNEFGQVEKVLKNKFCTKTV